MVVVLNSGHLNFPDEKGKRKVTTLRMVDDAIDHIIPHEPFAVQKALSGRSQISCA